MDESDESGSPQPDDDLLAEVAHELTNPLTIAAGFARNLLDDNADQDATRQAARAIDRNIKIALHLLDTYRHATRRSEAPISLDLEWVPVGRLVDDTVDDLDTLLETHTVDVHHDDPGLQILADAARLRQALFNLLSNAVKHTDPGTAIHVRTITDAGQVIFEVADEGDGVAPEHVDVIFGVRARGDTDANGLGLGLHVARQIADAHGGSLQLVPAENTGAIFHLTLPLDQPNTTDQ